MNKQISDALHYQVASLREIGDLGLHYFTASNLELLSRICFTMENPEVGLQILSSSQNARAQFMTPVHPIDLELHDALVTGYQGLFSQERYQTLWERGQTLDIMDCLALL